MSENTEQKPQVVDKRRFTADSGPGEQASETLKFFCTCGHVRGMHRASKPHTCNFAECNCEGFKLTRSKTLEVFSPSSDPNKPVGMDFTSAIKQVLEGKRVTRLEWNNPEIYLLMFMWGNISPKQPAGKYLSIHHADGSVNPLVINDGDMLGDDWVVVV